MNPSNPHPASLPIDQLLRHCDIRRGRRSGPGGQHRNKVETAIVIRYQPDEVQAEASERRSQEQNRQVAIRRLRVQLALRVRRPFQSPSETWRRRAANGRIRVSTEHDDFPAVLAEALDAYHHTGSTAAAAERLQVSTSQLIKLLKQAPEALAQVNADRLARGEHPLR